MWRSYVLGATGSLDMDAVRRVLARYTHDAPWVLLDARPILDASWCGEGAVSFYGTTPPLPPDPALARLLFDLGSCGLLLGVTPGPPDIIICGDHSTPEEVANPGEIVVAVHDPEQLNAIMTGMSDTNFPPCPECASEYTYEMDPLLVCPECGHEWNPDAPAAEDAATDEPVIRDSVGNVLEDGDSVTVVKTLKVKGASQPIKAGTTVRNIRLIPPVDGHDIDARVDGFGQMKLKSSIVKKI